MGDFVDRRTVLRSGAVATALGLAGCLSRLPGDDSTPDGNQSDDSEPDDDGEDQRSAVESWPSFQYDAGNSGHAEGRGPRGNLTEVWSFEREGKMRGGPVISEDGVVYIGSDEGTMYALDLEDGSLVWSTEIPVPVSRVPIVSDDLVLVSTTDGVYAFDRHSGDEEWNFVAAKGATTPALQDGIAVLGDGTNHVNGIDVVDGTELWRTENDKHFTNPAAISNGDAFVSDWTNELHIFELKTGRHRFSAELDEAQFTGATVVDDVIYAGGEQGGLYALDATSLGDELWQINIGELINQSPAVTSERLIVCAMGGKIVAVDRETATEKWSKQVDSWAISAPAIVGDSVYVGGSFGSLYGFDISTGKLTVLEELTDRSVHHPVVSDDFLVVGTSDGNVHALRE